jgi:hypothetical protein
MWAEEDCIEKRENTALLLYNHSSTLQNSNGESIIVL